MYCVSRILGERYDRDLKDLFDLQDDITKNVTMAMQVKLTVGQIAHLLGKDTKNLKAYLNVMKGLSHNRRFNNDDNQIAKRLYGEAIALDPDYANAYVFLAWTYYHEALNRWTKTPTKSFEKAMELAKKAISLDEQNATAYMVFAYVYAQIGQFKKAAAAQEKALSLDPADSYINALYGMTLYNVGKFKEAILFYKKAIRIDPKPPGIYLNLLGLSYLWTVQNEEAIAVFKKLVSREPENAHAHALLGVALIGAGKEEEAIPIFDKALSLNPDGPGWYTGGLAVARASTGQALEAITTLREALGLDPDNAQISRYLSLVLSYVGKYEESLSMARNALNLKKKTPGPMPDTDFYLTLGLSHFMMEQYVEAIAAFNKAISISTEYVYALIGLTASYSLAGRMEEARAEAAEVLRINPKITLEDITKNGYYNFQKADKERIVNALRKAGLK